jgi:hypothetical protein
MLNSEQIHMLLLKLTGSHYETSHPSYAYEHYNGQVFLERFKPLFLTHYIFNVASYNLLFFGISTI